MAISRLTLCIRLKNNAVSQYRNYNFNSGCVLNGIPIAANEDGIYQLDNRDNDHGTEIDAFFEVTTTNFGVDNAKRMRKAFIGYEASGNMVLKVKADDEKEQSYFLKPVKKGQLQHKTIVPLGREIKGDFFTYRFENQNGCDFSIDSFNATAVFLNMGR